MDLMKGGTTNQPNPQVETAIEVLRGEALSEDHLGFINQWSEEYFGHVAVSRDFKRAKVDWYLFLSSHGELISHVALSEMTILLDQQGKKAGAIGGLLTARPHMGKGFANQLMTKAEDLLFGDLQADLGILFCLPSLVPFYARRGWILVKTPVTLQQTDAIVTWPEAVMVLPAKGELWNDPIIHVSSQIRRSPNR